ncbi:MAG: AMP-binding protein [Aggregatilineales bacterium]
MPVVPIRLDSNPTTLLEQARWLYEHKADQAAVVLIAPDNDEQAITYGEFFEQAARYANALEGAGVKSGDLVALILQHGEAVLYGFWGAMLLGAVPSIFPFLSDKLDPERYFDSIRQLVTHEDIRVIITYSELEGELSSRLHESQTTLINKDTLQPSGNATHYLSQTPAQPEDTAFLQHSSGSTGLQKGVMLSHRAVINHIASYSEAIHLSPDDVIVSWLPLYHDMGLIAGFITPILQGVKLVLMSPFHWVRDPKMLLLALDHYKGTLCWLPNFAYNFLATRVREADIEGLDLSSVRALINCSEPVMAESHAIFIERFAPYGLRDSALTVCYAMAENTFAVTQAGIDAPLKIDVVDRDTLMSDRRAQLADGDSPTLTFVSNGKPIAHCEIRIVDENRQNLPERHVGEITLKSTFMLSGYFKRPETTATAMDDGWYFTGDMGYVAEGELFITGRKKDLIIVGGKNVYPQDIENLLNEIPGIHPGRTSAFGVMNDKLGTEDIAIVAEVNGDIDATDRNATAPIIKEVRARIAQNTDVTARYVHIVAPKWLVKTSSGKIARTANREKFIKEVLKQG